MAGENVPPPGPSSQLSLQTLVSVIQNAVQAQNRIAAAITALTTAFNVAFPPPTQGNASWTPGGIANGASAAISFTVTGISLGDFVEASVSTTLQGCQLTADVIAANKVQAVISNLTGGTVTFSATTLTVSVT